MDQLHESLNGLLFIKPLKGKRRRVSDRSHLTEWKGSPGSSRHLTTPACTQAQQAQAVAEFWSDPKMPRGGRPRPHAPVVHSSTAHRTPPRQSQGPPAGAWGCASTHSPAAPGGTWAFRGSPAPPHTSLSTTGSACPGQGSHQLLTTLMFTPC